TRVSNKYQLSDHSIGLIDETVLKKHPEVLLEIFLFMLTHNLQTITADTIRLLRKYRDKITADYRNKESHQQIFMAILKSDGAIAPILRLMNRHGILGRYIPEFDHTIGQMQYDLFHVYTVDEHTLFVIENLYNFTLERTQERFPLATKL